MDKDNDNFHSELFDSGDPMHPRIQGLHLLEEITDILDSIKAIKGFAYANALANIFATTNLTAGMLFIIGNLSDIREIDKKESNRIQEYLSTQIADIISEQMHLLSHYVGMMGAETLDAYKGSNKNCVTLSKELQDDLDILLKKQGEYNARMEKRNSK